jgi:hypothetical protein
MPKKHYRPQKAYAPDAFNQAKSERLLSPHPPRFVDFRGYQKISTTVDWSVQG